MSNTPSVPAVRLAIVGVAGRFPQASNVNDLWSLLSRRGFAIGPVPPERWDASQQLDPEKTVQAVGGFLDGVDQFDPTFFGISPREAEDIDPQQRLMLEASWTAFEDAGVRPELLAGSHTGVYVGASWHDYEILRKERGLRATQHTAVGNALDVIAARISYYYGLKGPSLTVETGCSSAMVALHLAGQALASGEIEAALVGGVNLILAPDVSIGLTRFGGLSAKGRCSAFSEEADGFVRGEGVVALYLKTLDRARADGDRIHAVIAGTAINNDGGGDSLVTPSAAGQEDLLRRIYAQSGVDLNEVVYIEAHGTGTSVGDPIEIGAIGRALALPREQAQGKLAVGSVKTNIGHLEATAGLAGVVKALLAIRHRMVPPSLHSESLNPKIDFDGLRVEIVRSPYALPSEGPFYVGVNAFGWGGTNAHVILAPPPAADLGKTAPENGPVLLPVSAQNDTALRQRAGDLAALLQSGTASLRDVAGTLAWHRGHFPRRLGFVAETAESMAEALTAFASSDNSEIIPVTARKPGRVAFVFPGQGSQWAGMGTRLMEESPIFAETIRACGAALAPYVDWNLEDIVSGRAGDAWLEQVDKVQPVLWAMGVALSALWRANGVSPDVVVGHSQGEVAAATVAGILDLGEAARVVATRSSIIRRKAGKGLMLAVDLDLEGARAAIVGFEDLISIAVNNGPRSCVLSGDAEAINTLKALLDADEVFNRLVRVDYASHSPHMDEFKEELAAALEGLAPRMGDIELFSTVELRPMPGTAMDANYWVRNLREPVLFADAMLALFRQGVTHVVEISPHTALAPAIEQLAALVDEPPRVLSTMKRDFGTLADLTGFFGRAYEAGLEPFGSLPCGAHVALPAYPWQRQSYWIATARPRNTGRSGFDITLLPTHERDVWEGALELSLEDHPWLRDHKVQEATVFPGAAMMALALAAGRARFGTMPRRLSSIRFLSDLTLGEDACRLSLVLRDDLTDGGSFSLRSLPAGSAHWIEHAVGIAEQHMPPVAMPSFPGHLRGAEPREPASFYEACTARGLNYGPSFQTVTSLFTADSEALGEIRLTPACRASARPHGLHPALWDGALQISLALSEATQTVVPVSVGRVMFLIDPEEAVTSAWAHAIRRDEQHYDLVLYTADERPLAIIEQLALKPLTLDADTSDMTERVHRLEFVPAPLPEAAAPARRWLVCGKGAETLAAALTAAGANAQPVSETALPDSAEADGLVFLAPPSEAGLPVQEAGLMHLAELVRRAGMRQVTPCLAIVTTNAQAHVWGGSSDPGAALFWGFARVLRREHRELDATVIDVTGTPDWAAACAAELIYWPGDDQVVLPPEGHAQTRYVGRLARGEAASGAEGTAPAWASPRQPFRLVSSRPGFWDALEYRPLRRQAPGSDEVEIEISAAALNFIDVMKAMGTYPGLDERSARLGGEFAGRVVAVGENVSTPRVGDRVVACGFGAFASHATVLATHTQPIPSSLTDAEAAALPLVMATAWYGLVDLADLAPGETVLIHSAAGGLGLAAINVARLCGASVIATAGSEEKRQMLRDMGIAHVFDSRDLSWVEGVREATGGRGVDVVLNSLTGIAISLGLESLAPDGRFIEVGKKDIYAGRSINLSAFRNRLSISSVDLAGLMEKRPERFAQLFADVWEAVESGKLAKLPINEMTFANAGEALRTMGRGAHVGKFVLVAPETVSHIAPEPLQAGRFRQDATYLITGGLGALGLSLAEHMAALGVGGLALLGRSQPGEKARETIAALRAQGVDARSFAVDVSDRDALGRVLEEIRATMPHLRGVVHAAGLLDDALIANLHPDQLRRVLAPKIDGALNLDALTANDPLDFFVLFSSAAALVGNPGQAAYAAGNSALDALAQRRRAEGRPGLSVQWGPFAEIGLAAQEGIRGARLEERGMGSFTAEEGWLALAQFLRTGETVASYVPLHLRQWFEAYPDTAAQAAWQGLREAARGNAATGGSQVFRAAIEAAPESERQSLAEDKVRELAGRVLRLDPRDIDRDTPFKALGLDSLMGLELRNRLETAFGLKLSPTLLWTYGNAHALAAVLCERIFKAAA